MEVRRPLAQEWACLRAIRLRALADSPGAFARTLDEERTRPEREWRNRAGGSYVAVAPDGSWVGMVGGLLEPESPQQAHLVGMWVAPDWRRRGVARRLAAAVIAWAEASGATEIHLWVAEANGSARALYDSLGFRPTGARQPLPSDPAVPEIMMRRRLGPAGP